MGGYLLTSVHFVQNFVHCGLAVHSLVYQGPILACLQRALAACACALARLEVIQVVLRKRMDAFLPELPRDLGKRTSDPW